MKRIFFTNIPVMVVMGLLTMACKKPGSTTSINNRTLKVLEIETNLPVANASVALYKCVRPNAYGCLKDSVVQTSLTDKNGTFQYDSKLDVYFITGSAINYWDGYSGGDFTGLGDVYLTPLAHTKIHLKKINVHPPELLLHININEKLAPLYSWGVNSSYKLPSDSTVLMESYGNNDNHLTWNFTDISGAVVPIQTGGEMADYYINRFDTASVELNY